ncbi:hypothetical protein COV16_03465, partial [Candidatus Woesearchaeota archaeon CG10_big_fil_rev_8_21_14_0_10_34_8]
MQLSAEQQQAMEAQKAQCPFCKIVKGDIPSKKVYEDDLLLGVLDINPAAKGHILLMPKEHYPIMPLIPPETFEHLFKKTRIISKSVKEGMLLFGDTVYIANGYAAGQQSSHFMLHIIPREQTDGLDFFTLKKGVVDEDKLEEAFNLLKHNLPIMLRQRYAKYAMEGMPASGQPTTGAVEDVQAVMPQQQVSLQQPAVSPSGPMMGRQYNKESLIKLIESNPQLKQLVSKYPDDFRRQINENSKLKSLFANINIEEIIEHFKVEEEEKYTMNELVDIINDNPKLKEMLLKQTLQFAAKVKHIPELRKVFGHVDIEELERAVLSKEVKEEQDVSEILKGFSPQQIMSVPKTIEQEDPSIAG